MVLESMYEGHRLPVRASWAGQGHAGGGSLGASYPQPHEPSPV
jgi:hypothetical protein